MSIFSHSGRLRRVRARGLLQLLINVRDLSDARTWEGSARGRDAPARVR